MFGRKSRLNADHQVGDGARVYCEDCSALVAGKVGTVGSTLKSQYQCIHSSIENYHVA